MWSVVLGLVFRLFDIPRYHNDDGTENKGYPAQSERWRAKIAVALSFCILMDFMLALFVLFALGFVGPGFAIAGDVDDVKAQLIAEKIDQVSATLCMDQSDWPLLNYRRELQTEYRDIKGHDHEAPPCEILLKLRR